MPPAARVGDQHACPAHVGGPIASPGSTTVNIGGQPAARAGDRATCSGPPDTIVQGAPTVFIDGRPAARAGDKCGHSGVIVTGCPTVNIGAQGPAAEELQGRSPFGFGKKVDDGPAVRTAPKDPEGTGTGAGSGVEKKPKATVRPTAPKSPDASSPEAAPEKAEDEKSGPKLFGSPVSMELIRSIAKLAQQMIPGLAGRVPPVDPQVMQATIAELREAIARKDVDAVNAISARLTAMMQGGAGAAGATEPPSNTSPWQMPPQR